MIAKHHEPKGLSRDARAIGGFIAAASHRENAERGSAMLRDAILLAKGITPPPYPAGIRLTQIDAHKPMTCPVCDGPFKPAPRIIAHIQETVAAYYGIPPKSMVSDERRYLVSRPRQVAMYLACEITGKSYPEIGRRFGNKDHSTVIHARRAVEKRMAEDAEVMIDVEVLRDRLAA